MTIYNTNGLEKYWLNKTSEVTQITYRLIQRDFIPNKAPENSLTCRFRIDILDEKTTKKITLCNRKHGKGYAILGDSHATDLFNSVISTNTYPFIIGITKGGCRLSENVSPSKCNFNEFFSYIKHNKNIFHGLIYEQAGFTLLKTKKEKGNRVMFNQKGEKETIKNIYINVDSVNKTYKHLYKMSKYIKVIWFGSRVEPHITKRIIIKNGCDYEFKLRPNQKEVFKKLDTYIKTLDFNKNNLSFISQNNTFNYQFPDDFMSCKALYWSDGDHLSTSGEKRFGERFDILGLFSH